MAPQTKTLFSGLSLVLLCGGILLYVTTFATIKQFSQKGTVQVLSRPLSTRLDDRYIYEEMESIEQVWSFPSAEHNMYSVELRSTAPERITTPRSANTKVESKNNEPGKTNEVEKDKALYDSFYHKKMDSQTRINTTSRRNNLSCHIPLLNPWDAKVLPHIKNILTSKRKPITCDDNPILLQLSEDRQSILLNNKKFEKYENKTQLINCMMASFSLYMPMVNSWHDIPDIKDGFKIAIPEESDVIFIGCAGILKAKAKIRLALEKKGWVYRQELLRLTASGKNISSSAEKQKPPDKRRLSVLMFYNDGVSHLMSRRVMNKTYYYLMNERNGVALNGYNSVGENTFPNMTPLLTGYHIDELPPYKGKHFDTIAWPFVWSNFSKLGYTTGYIEDSEYPTFDYIKKGFFKKPTDYYFSRYLKIRRKLGGCDADGVTVNRQLLEALDQFLTIHGSDDYFFLWFLNALSHYGAAPLTRVDDGYYRFFKKHFERGTFNNTLIIFGSDHGARFGSIRSTQIGLIEEKMPLQVHVYPEWFKREHKDKFQTLLKNQDSLTTAFDVHEMLLDIVNETETNKDKRRGKNLFKEQVSESRTCSEAGIPDHYCVCRDVQPFQTSSPFTASAVDAAVKQINKRLEPYTDICAPVVLDHVANALIANGTIPNKRFYFDYIITFETMPYHALFEATVRRFNESTDYQVVGQPARISLYGDTAYCMDDAELRNYCYCKVQRPQAGHEQPKLVK